MALSVLYFTILASIAIKVADADGNDIQKPIITYMFFNKTYCFLAVNNTVLTSRGLEPNFRLRLRSIKTLKQNNNVIILRTPHDHIDHWKPEDIKDENFKNRSCFLDNLKSTVVINFNVYRNVTKEDKGASTPAVITTHNTNERDPNFYIYVGIGIALLVLIMLFLLNIRKVRNTHRTLQFLLYVIQRAAMKENDDREAIILKPINKRPPMPLPHELTLTG